MLFSSITFLYAFLVILLAVYYLSPRVIKNFVLMAFSLCFYAWGEPKYVFIMLGSITVGYVFGILTEVNLNKEKIGLAKLCTFIAVAVNLGVLFFFKYAGFFAVNLSKLPGVSIGFKALALPLGISFYTFQILSYSIDVLKGSVKAQKNPINLACYVTLFPQLIAGPIVRYETVCEELGNRKETVELFATGIRRFITGLGKKVLLANMAGEIFDTISNYSQSETSVLLTWMMTISFSLQLYFDFSGYSDMAIGLGKMLGFNFLENFNYPYISSSITDFWRRWHISLSTWFRDYVYIPLGGNRKGKGRSYINMFVVWALTGFWHGAEWNFIIWGLYYFVLLFIEKMWLGKLLSKLPKFISHIYALFLINFGWVIFSFDNMNTLGKVIKNMFFCGGIDVVNDNTIYMLLSYGAFLIIAMIAATPLPKLCGEHLMEKTKSEALRSVIELVFLFAVMLLATAFLASESFNPFLYFRF